MSAPARSRPWLTCLSRSCRKDKACLWGENGECMSMDEPAGDRFERYRLYLGQGLIVVLGTAVILAALYWAYKQ